MLKKQSVKLRHLLPKYLSVYLALSIPQMSNMSYVNNESTHLVLFYIELRCQDGSNRPIL